MFAESLKDLFQRAFPIEKTFVAGLPFPQSSFAAQAIHHHTHSSKLVKAIEGLFDAVNFDSAAETVLPENIALTKQAFERFLERTGLTLSQYAFQDILVENTKDYEFRADGTTPNWYHFFRQVVPKLNNIRNGQISEQTLNKYGGLDTLVAATLYHDSWEDHGKTPHMIFARLEKHIYQLSDQGKTDEASEYRLRRSSAEVAAIVDYCSRKHPVIGADGQLVKKPEGGFKKTLRFGGDLNAYYNTHFKHPFALWIKWDDSGEGASTRELPDMLERAPEMPFSVESNIKFASERRALYFRRANIKLAIERWPDFERVFNSAHSMLSVNLSILETVNDYAQSPNLRPENGMPMFLSEKDIKHSLKGYDGIPAGWCSYFIHMERLEDLGQSDERILEVLSHVISPAMEPLITNDNDPDLRTEEYSVSFG